MESSLLTMVMMTSLPSAAPWGVDEEAAPSATSGSHLDAVRLYTVTWNPARSRLRAMGAPIVPSPIKAICFMKFHTFANF
ncbi:hypothetical protein D3C73_1550070 [compost metagenome]